MTIAQYINHDTGKSFIAKGDERYLRRVFFDYVIDSHAIMFFDTVRDCKGLELSSLEDITADNFPLAYEAFNKQVDMAPWFIPYGAYDTQYHPHT